VAEWSAERNDWIPLAPDGVITDPCLLPDLPALALVDALASDNAAARAIIARHKPEYLVQQARLAIRRENLIDVLDHRKIALDESQWVRIHVCEDLDTLERWLRRAIDIDNAAALLD
jgi:hypothetical protein